MTNDPYLRLKSRFNRIGALGEGFSEFHGVLHQGTCRRFRKKHARVLDGGADSHDSGMTLA